MLIALGSYELVNGSENEHHKSSVQVCFAALSGRTVAPSTSGGGFKQHDQQTEWQPSSADHVHKTHREHEGRRQ